MRQTLRTWAMATFMILAWVLQFNLVTDYKTSKYLKEEMEIALHDAGLFVNNQELANGKIIYDTTLAYNAFVNSLELNTNLSDLQPTSNTYFNELEVVTFKVFDDSNTTFPYEYVDPTFGHRRTFNGPTIYVIIETYSPRFFAGEPKLIRREASYTYNQ